MPRRRHLRRSAFGQNPEFYKFYRSLEAYRATFKNRAT
jgi:membrane protease subunit HflC